MKEEDGRFDADPTEGFFIASLGLCLLMERDGGRMNRISFSSVRPEVSIPPEEKEALLRCWPGGEKVPWDLLDLSGLTEFQREVLSLVASIPLGETLTYGQVAEGLGRPKAARAVGSALKRNPFPLIVPCHRVVGSKDIGGYSLGVDLKKRLLEVEKEICHLNLLLD